MKDKVRVAALYLRLSQDRTGASLGIDRQEELCRALVDARGWTVGGVYTDRDRSAYSGKRRPEYDRMLGDLKAKRVGAVVAVDQDRVARRLTELTKLLDTLGALGVPIVTTAGDLDSTTADGRLKIHILGSVAEHESGKKSERLLRQREQAARLGTYHGGRRPFGYEADGVTIRESEAVVYRDAVAQLLAGESLGAIARKLDAGGVPTVRGKRWRTTSVRSMLANPRHAGRRVFRGEDVGPAVWPALVDYADHLRVRSILGNIRITTRGRPPARLLSSMLRCGRCGVTLYASTRPDGTPRYSCAPSPGTDACGRIAVAALPLEQLIADAVLHRIDTPAVRKAARLKPKRTAGGVSAIADLELELEQLAADHGAGKISRREWLAATEPLRARLTAARAELERDTGTAAIAELGDIDVRERWPALDTDQQRRIVAALIDHIDVNPWPAGGRQFAPQRIDIAWRA